MFRTKQDRIHRKVIAEYHQSKNWRFPEQAKANVREPLETLATGYVHYRTNREVYESPMIEAANEKFFREYFRGKRKSDQIFCRYDKGYQSYYHELAKRNDIRHGSAIIIRQEVEDYLADYVNEWDEGGYLRDFEEDGYANAIWLVDYDLDHNGEYQTKWGFSNGKDLSWFELQCLDLL
jgi:hypothetical protein